MEDTGIADLDELILRCKAAAARSYIAEAVGCYKAGAFRAGIVATWVAVAFDFIDKLRQLDLTGDKAAGKYLAEFEQIRRTDNISGALKFEREILTRARELELISSLEHTDLDRLLEDRNRCAHPSMNTIDEMYQPPPELARLHLRNAVTHLLQHPPVQGKAALDRLVHEVSSEYFPKETAKAIEYLKVGPLDRPRESLVRNFVVVLLKTILLQADLITMPRYTAALNAIRQMHRGAAELTISEKLNDLLRMVGDDSLWQAINALAQLPDTWPFIKDDMQTRLKTFVMSAQPQYLILFLDEALTVQGLRETALERVKSIPQQELANLIGSNGRTEYCDRAIELYGKSSSYDEANSIATALVEPLCDSFTQAHWKALSNAADANSQIRDSWNWKELNRKLKAAGL